MMRPTPSPMADCVELEPKKVAVTVWSLFQPNPCTPTQLGLADREKMSKRSTIVRRTVFFRETSFCFALTYEVIAICVIFFADSTLECKYMLDKSL